MANWVYTAELSFSILKSLWVDLLHLFHLVAYNYIQMTQPSLHTSPWNLDGCVQSLCISLCLGLCVCACARLCVYTQIIFNYLTVHVGIYILCALWYVFFAIPVEEHVFAMHHWRSQPCKVLCSLPTICVTHDLVPLLLRKWGHFNPFCPHFLPLDFPIQTFPFAHPGLI